MTFRAESSFGNFTRPLTVDDEFFRKVEHSLFQDGLLGAGSLGQSTLSWTPGPISRQVFWWLCLWFSPDCGVCVSC